MIRNYEEQRHLGERGGVPAIDRLGTFADGTGGKQILSRRIYSNGRFIASDGNKARGSREEAQRAHVTYS